MARGEVSSEESTEVESSATPSHDDIDNDDSSDKDSRARSGHRGQAWRKGPRCAEEEPSAYEVQRQQRTRRNLAVFLELGVARLAAQIKSAEFERRELEAVTIAERRIGSSKCVYGPLCLPS